VEILENMESQMKRLQDKFGDVRVGVYPLDFGRFNQNMKYYLEGLNIVGIYLANPTFNGQDFPIYTDMRLFLESIDVCLIWGRDEVCIDMADYISRHGSRVKMVDLLDRSENYALIHSENEYEIIDYDNLTDNQKVIFHDNNIDINFVKKTVDEDILWEISWKNQIDFIPFDLNIIKNTKAIAFCPECGKICYSDRSFVVTGNYFGGVIFYLFHCHHDFFVLKKWENLMGIYIPDKELFIKFRKMRMHSSRPDPDHNYTALVDQFKIYLVYFVEEVSKYLANGGPRKLQFILGYQNNLGHHLCNELSAIQRFIDSGDTDIIQDPLLMENDYYSFKELFPEIVNVKLSKSGTDKKRLHSDIFRRCLKENCLSLFLYTFAQLPAKLAEKLIDHSKIKYESKLQKLEEIVNLEDRWPVIWITIRTEKRRRWINQAEGIAYVLNKLHINYPNLAAVFDGISTAEQEYQHIKSLLNNKIKCYNGLHFSIEDTIWWVRNADAFIAAFGNGMIFNYIANIPGVLHANTAFIKEHNLLERDTNYYFAPRENCKPFVIIPANYEDVSEPDPRLRNYRIDNDVLYHTVMQVLIDLIRSKIDPQNDHGYSRNLSE
jgi:hypothetical protein